MTEPTPLPEWARAWAERAYLNPGSPVENFAEALVAVRREALTEAAKIAEGGASLVAGTDIAFITPAAYAADLARDISDGIRALADKAPT